PTRDRFLLVMYSNAQTLISRLVDPAGKPQSAVGEIHTVQHTWNDKVAEGDFAEHDVVYNPTTDEYLVVWAQGTGPFVYAPQGARWDTVFGQRFSAATGSPVGPAFQLNQIRGESAWCSVRRPVVE